MKSTLFIMGPDDFGRSSFSGGNGSFRDASSITVKGVLPIYPYIREEDKIKNNSFLFILGLNESIQLENKDKSTNVVNLIGDADGSKKTLKAVNLLINSPQFNRVFNHPENIYKTSRVNLSRLLNGISNVKIARVEIFYIETIEDLNNNINNTFMSYPLIIRLEGFHNSEFMVRVDSEDDLIGLTSWLDQKRSFIIIEYIDCIDTTGLYRKARIAVIDGKFYPQHFLTSKNWCVGADARYNLMLEHKQFRDAEQHYLESFNTNILPHYKKQLLLIHEKIGLDIYGIDCFFGENGELVIFELNACMDLLSMWLGPNGEYNYKKPFRSAVSNAIIELITN